MKHCVCVLQGSDRTGQMRTHSVGYGGSGEVWEQGASGGSSDDASGSACARMKRRRLRVQVYRGLYSHCQDSMTTPELTSHIKHFTFKLFKVGHLNLKC